MAEATKTSFLGTINPWSRSTSPAPRSPRQPPQKEEPLKPTSGLDHAISARPTPSVRRYPNDCPALKSRWYYAVDIAKRKPFIPEVSPEERAKNPPRKWVLFSEKDSKAIESAFQQLGREDEFGEKQTSTKIPVNEDYLYDVHIEKRELEPAYWIGPQFDVKRGTWFYQDNTPCDENLANQLEEGYLKTTPWRKTGAPRSASQPRTQPSMSEGSQAPTPAATAETPWMDSYRLFGTYMNTTATYFDTHTAYLSADDFMSRMSSTVYGRFGAQTGTKVVRGYTEPLQAAPKPADTSTKEKRTSKLSSEVSADPDKPSEPEKRSTPPRPSALERQLSSLAGLARSQTQTQDQQKQEEEEEARAEEEQEMEDAREKIGEDQGRKIDHLVLVTHGIGQRLGLRLDSINFVHDVNMMRKTMKAVYEASPDLKALTDDPKNSTVQILPVCWRHLLDFPKQSLKQNRKEHDLADLDTALEEEYPSLQDITVDGVPAVRNLITDLALDVLLYQSAYREHLARIVQQEANRVYQLFKKRTGFDGTVSLVGHSLGSLIFFDLLCRQAEDAKTRPRRVSSKTSALRETNRTNEDISLDFACENFFAIGSPIALFQMLKGRTIAGRPTLKNHAPPTSPFDPDPTQNNPFQSMSGGDITSNPAKSLLPISASSPKVSEFYNIFHPTDPIAYRIEPLISPAMSSLKPQALPYTKRGLFAAPGMANLTARVGQQVMSSWYSLTSGVASSLINRSLGITGEEQALPQDKSKPASQQLSQPTATTASGDNGRDSIMPPPPVTEIINTGKKQKAIAEQLNSDPSSNPEDPPNPTLIDTDIETLYSGFQKARSTPSRRRSATTSSVASSSTTHTRSNSIDVELEQEKARRLRREEAKVRALNSNGRVDYAIQEGMFDVSLLASIASHLSYWADADVNHFMVGQMLKGKQREKDKDKDKIVL